MKEAISRCFAVIFFLQGCVFYSPTDPIIKVPDFYKAKVQQEGLYVIADPYVSSEKSEYVFGTDLARRGLYAIHLIFQNWGDRTFDLSKGEAALVDSKGRKVLPLTEKEVAKKVLRNTAARALGFGAMGSLLILFSVPFAIGGGLDSYLSNREIKRDVEAKMMAERVLKPKEIKHGFLFFPIQSGTETEGVGEEYTLELDGVIDLKTHDALRIEIPVTWREV